MRKAVTYLLTFCIVITVFTLVERTPAQAYEMYFLSVGNSQYRDEELEIPDANRNSRQVAQNLRQAGAVDGITLVSEPGAYLTRNDVLDALSEVVNKAKSGSNPILVYYFIGHGAARGEGWSHVSLLGNYESSVSADEARSHGIIETREVKQFLEKQRIPYILVLDNCYYRAPESGLLLFSRQIQESLMSLGEAIGRIPSGLGETWGSEMIGVVFYAAKPGSYVPTLPDPWYERRAMGPLARRLVLLLGEAFESEQDLSVGLFLEQMADPVFDPASIVGHYTVWISDLGLIDETPASLAPYRGDPRLQAALISAGEIDKSVENIGETLPDNSKGQ